MGPKEVHGQLVPPGKAYELLTDHMITDLPLWSEPAQEKSQTIHAYKSLWLTWVAIFEALFGCHDSFI